MRRRSGTVPSSLGVREHKPLYGVASRRLVMRTGVVGLPERLRRAALPIGAACERDRVAGALADLGEVFKRGAGIFEESQRNPAGGELVLGAIALPVRYGGGARDAIGGFGVAEVEQRSGNKPPLDPPLVDIDR